MNIIKRIIIFLNRIKANYIAIKFRRKTLGKGSPAGMCFTISVPLSIHLTNKGFKNTIRRGHVGIIDHYWISLDDENGFIIDVTAKQFNKDLDYVAIEEEYDFQTFYAHWASMLINNSTTPPIETYIRISIKAAIILLKDIKHVDATAKYLENINKALENLKKEAFDKSSTLDDTEKFLQLCKIRNI